VASAEFKEKVRSLGIARDAETDPVGAKQSVETAIAGANLKNVRVSTFILPDEHSSGNVETLCIRSVQNEEVYACVAEFFECVKRKDVKLPDGPALYKHYAQVFMATKHEPQMFPGKAAYKHMWPLDGDVFRPLREFLAAL
jgi:hypothetical protein